MNVKSNGRDGRGMDISRALRGNKAYFPIDMVVSIVNKQEIIPAYFGSKWLNMNILKIIMKTKMNGVDTQ